MVFRMRMKSDKLIVDEVSFLLFGCLEEVNIFNDVIEELLSDTQKIQNIKEKYKNDDWE